MLAGPWAWWVGSVCVCGSDWVGCTGRGEARGSRELCACAGIKCYVILLSMCI